MLVELINPDTRLCAIDGTDLRSSKYDIEAKYGKDSHIGYYKDYKLHCIVTVTDIIIPLVIDTSPEMVKVPQNKFGKKATI